MLFYKFVFISWFTNTNECNTYSQLYALSCQPTVISFPCSIGRKESKRRRDQGCEKSDTCHSRHSNTHFIDSVNLLVSIRFVRLMFPIRHPWQRSELSPSPFAFGKKPCHGSPWNMYIRDVSDLSVDNERGKNKSMGFIGSICLLTFTFDDVSNIMVDRSNTNLAAVICALLRSSFKSFCLSPVISCHQLNIAKRISYLVNMFNFFFSIFASSFHFINDTVGRTITFISNWMIIFSANFFASLRNWNEIAEGWAEERKQFAVNEIINFRITFCRLSLRCCLERSKHFFPQSCFGRFHFEFKSWRTK